MTKHTIQPRPYEKPPNANNPSALPSSHFLSRTTSARRSPIGCPFRIFPELFLHLLLHELLHVNWLRGRRRCWRGHGRHQPGIGMMSSRWHYPTTDNPWYWTMPWWHWSGCIRASKGWHGRCSCCHNEREGQETWASVFRLSTHLRVCVSSTNVCTCQKTRGNCKLQNDHPFDELSQLKCKRLLPPCYEPPCYERRL